MTDWYTADDNNRLSDAWPDALGVVDTHGGSYELLGMLLDVARQQVVAFAAEDASPALQVSELLTTLGVEEETVTAVLGTLAFDEDDANPEPPSRYVYAQLQQAKNLWKAGLAAGDGLVGGEGFSFTPRPLDKTIQRVIRPTSGAIDVL